MIKFIWLWNLGQPSPALPQGREKLIIITGDTPAPGRASLHPFKNLKAEDEYFVG
jgi:hypothetical protein